ncbi:hypothetical protein HU200_004742 [Digitaria exilis]|uniref:NADP-dependent oxidoreductase domain-containing protein n=1 Tax=Digitaria exilis TaxID=1010633 RepID=A0A835KS36_9POAL|nr:hypothetical protein HU200_004742 [Digitaria exilis]
MATHFVLNTGAEIPSVGFGTWQSKPDVVGDSVYAAVKVRAASPVLYLFTLFGFFILFSLTALIGLALQKLFEEGIVKREDLFITSKLWHDHHDPEDVPESLDKSLNALQLEYLDLYLAYSPLGSPGTPWFNSNVLKEPVVTSIADKLGRSPAQVALRWNIQMGHSVLPKSLNEQRIKQNLDVYDWSIPDDLLAKFSEIKQGVRLLVLWPSGLQPSAAMARHFVLNTGAKIPSVGLGTWQADPGVVGNAVYAAVKAGYRHIDCARVYGNEKEIGLALKKLFEEGVVKREDLFITSKLWNDHHAPEDVPEALNASLSDLQLDYLDLYLIHWPFRVKKGTSTSPENFVTPDIPATWGAMEKLYDAGKVRAIGVSNFSSKKLGDLIAEARVPPAVDQVECHPGWQQTKLHNFCQSTGVHLTAYSPLGSPGTSWMNGNVLKEPVIISIAEKLGKTPAQVALRWNIQMGHSVLPKSTNEERIKQNLDVYDWSIPDDLLAKFSEIKQIQRPFQIKKGSEISPENFVQFDMPKTWQAMEKLYDSGKAYVVGVSNFTTKKLADLLALARVPPAVDQVECHLGWQQAKLRAFCHSSGVHFSADSQWERREAAMASHFVLNTGAKMPSLGLGTWQSDPGVVGDAVYAAVKVLTSHIRFCSLLYPYPFSPGPSRICDCFFFVQAGYRHIDCAKAYYNEKEIGLVLKKLFEEGVVKREDLFITSKLWVDDQAPEDVPEALNTSLNDLQLDYLDLYLIHWPFRVKKGTSVSPENFVTPDIPATWGAMEKLYDAGKARAIGVSNFSSKKLGDLLAVARVHPAVNQAYSPLGSPGTTWINGNVLTEPVTISIAEKLGKTPAQVALRWNIQMGHSVLP